MPHATVKMYSGRSESDKAKLAEKICEALTVTLNSGPDAISVAIEDVEPAHWMSRTLA